MLTLPVTGPWQQVACWVTREQCFPVQEGEEAQRGRDPPGAWWARSLDISEHCDRGQACIFLPCRALAPRHGVETWGSEGHRAVLITEILFLWLSSHTLLFTQRILCLRGSSG